MLALNQIYHIDFLEGIKNIDDECVDLCVTDPPYLWNKTTGGLSTTSVITSKWNGTSNFLAGGKTANMTNSIKFSQWLPGLYRVMKNPSHCYVFVNDKNVNDLINEALNVGFRLHNILVWHKNNKTPNLWYMKNVEFIVFLHKGKSFRINDVSSSQLLSCENIPGKKKLHPTEKPTRLLKYLIKNSSHPDQLVFDPFMGSGSTAVACVETQRKFLGFEIDPNFHGVSQNRLSLLGC